MSHTSLQALSRRRLRELAGERYFARGEAYFDEGRVRGLTEYRGKLTARVAGTEDYRVKLWADGDDLGYSCSCPLGDDGEFCKHCVAVGLAWLEETEAKGKRGRTGSSVATMEDVRALLERQDKSRLVEMLLNEALENESLRERLLLETARLNPERVSLATYRHALKRAIRTGNYVAYAVTNSYARGIRRAAEALAVLLADGHAAEVVELTEYALAQLEESLGYVDDSNGRVGGVAFELQELHQRACRQAQPEPVALARRLFAWEMRSEWEFFGGAAVSYADVLGQAGLAEYRRLAEAEWARVPALGPGEREAEYDSKRFRITQIMQTFARQASDVEALVQIMQRNLSHAYDYLQIAEAYRAAGRHDAALDWAERGWKNFAPAHDWRLGEFIADEYHRRGRHDEALSLMWEQFTQSPDLEHYRKLHTHAHTAGHSHWPHWRARALAHLRAAAAGRQPRGRRVKAYGRAADRSELVRVLLWEKRYDEAWQEACAGGCADDLWLQLAAAREAEHPADALTIYRERVAPLIELTNNTAYEQAVELLRKVRKLMLRLERTREFDDYLAALRIEYKRKRNFIQLLGTIS